MMAEGMLNPLSKPSADEQKSDSVLAEMCSPWLVKNPEVFDSQYKQRRRANNSARASL
jgi:hypothetical protein